MKPPLLISVRDPADAMCAHEQRCFERALGYKVQLVFAMHEKLDETFLVDRPALYFGGSGKFGVRDSHTWVHEFLDFLLLVVELKQPAYASCFAFQGLALAMGGEVGRDDSKQEMGVIDLELTTAGQADPLFSSLPTRFLAPLGHNDQVMRLPSGVTELARGELVEHQAFRVDGAPFWASQFHPELTKSTLLDRWDHYRSEFTDDPTAITAKDVELRAAPEADDVHLLLQNLVSASEA
jgi:GMP synthase (glutamine-hydrolysing)